MIEIRSEWVIAVSSGLLVLVTGWLAHYTRNLWGSTKDLVERSELIAKTHERAYLFCNVQPTGNPHALMNCRNRGRTLAFVKSIEWGLSSVDDFEQSALVSTIIDERLSAVTRIEVQEVIEPERQATPFWSVLIQLEHQGKIFFGRVVYEDVFRTAHYSTFKFLLARLEPGTVDATPLTDCYADWS